VVTDFLTEHFPDILNYNFTADSEKEFDNIAEGKIDWTKSIDEFYKKFHPTIEKTLEKSERKVGERILGTDPKTGRQLAVKIGRYGPLAQIGTIEDEEKPLFASLLKDQSIESITLEEALKLFDLPLIVGNFEDEPMQVAIGRFGPYVKHKSKFYSLPKGENPVLIPAERCIEIIEKKREDDKNKVINVFGDIQVLNGRFGPYIAFQKNNYKIPKEVNPQHLTEVDAKKLIEEQNKDGKKRRTATKKVAAKKPATKKSKA